MRSRWFVAALGYGPASPDGNGRVVTTDRVVSLWADQPTVALVLAIPVLLCALPLLVRPRRTQRRRSGRLPSLPNALPVTWTGLHATLVRAHAGA